MNKWPTQALLEKNRLSSDAPFLCLVKMTYEELDEPICLVRNNEDITWNGEKYTAYPMDFDTSTTDGATLPKLNWTVSNAGGTLQEYVQKNQGFTDAEVSLIVVHYNLLDNTEPLQQLDFVVTATTYDEEWVTFELGASPETIFKFPANIYMAHYCPYRFKSVRCGYQGNESACAGTLDTCRIPSRFGGEEGMNGNGY